MKRERDQEEKEEKVIPKACTAVKSDCIAPTDVGAPLLLQVVGGCKFGWSMGITAPPSCIVLYKRQTHNITAVLPTGQKYRGAFRDVS